MVAPLSPQLLQINPPGSPSPQPRVLPLLPEGDGLLAGNAAVDDLYDKVHYAERVLAPFLPPPPKRTRNEAVRNYMAVLNSEQPAVGDIDTVLRRLHAESSPLERGVVGPTGASATISFSVLGPIFGVYGFCAGAKIITHAHKASQYLSKLDTELQAREAELEQLKAASRTDPGLQLTVAELTSRIYVLQEFRRGVQLSVNEQRFNMTFPGMVQLSASSMILTLAVDLAPTLGGGSAIFSAAATLAFGVTASAILGVYAAGSMAKNGMELRKVFQTPGLKISETEAQHLREYKAYYNNRLHMQGAFYGLNTLTWGIYVAGAAVLIAALAGSVASHGIPEAMVVGGALGAVILDAIWGNEFAPHNTLTPHIDRNYLDTMQKRADLWKLLITERADLETTLHKVLATLPTTDNPNPSRLNLWEKLPKEIRYKYFWQLLPKRVFHGGMQRFSEWCLQDSKLVDPIVVEHMQLYTQREIVYLQEKHIARTAEVTLRILEFSKARDAGTEVDFDTLRQHLMQDGLALQNDEMKLDALSALQKKIGRVNVAALHDDPAEKVAWNRLRIEYMSIHGVLDNFIDRNQLLIHPTWYAYQTQPGRNAGNRGARLLNKQFTQAGVAALSERGFTPTQEKLFIQAVADLKSNRYETATILGIERTTQRKGRHKKKQQGLQVLPA